MTRIQMHTLNQAVRFPDLVDIDAFKQLLERFASATGVANSVRDLNGGIISQSDGVEACARFHCVHPETREHCRQSTLELMQTCSDQGIAFRTCKNGLLDYATPIAIDDQQVATLFMGQVLTQAPDLELFRQHALEHGFDETEYLDAIRKVPVVSHEQMASMMACMVDMTEMLANLGLSRLQQLALKSDLNRVTERQIQLEDLLELAPIGIAWSNADGRIEYLNHRFSELFGYTLEDIPDESTWDRLAYPDPAYRHEVVDLWHQRALQAHQKKMRPPHLEVNVRSKDGRDLRVLKHVSWVGDKQLLNFIDITTHWKGELRNRTHDMMLEMVARGEPLGSILASIAYNMELEDPSSMCSVLLLDRSGKHLITGAAPRLPEFYNQALEGIEIGPGVGSCGTAAFLGERVIVANISEHPYWEPYLELAQRVGVASCWSEPMLASDGRVLGTFAIYHAEPLEPEEEDIERIAFAANLAAIAIENQRTREELAEREQAFRTLAENAPDIIVRYDRDARLIYHNPRLVEALGVPSERLLGRQPREHGEEGLFDHYEDRIHSVIATGMESRIELNLPTPGGLKSYSVHMVAEHDSCNEITGVLGIARDITERKQMENELERQAHMDELTNLPNRRYFLDCAETELARIRRFGNALSLIMFDIDHFKRINDTYGHKIGDRVLRRIAETSMRTLRTIDTVGRIGGEEFVVLLPHTGLAQAVEVAERLRSAIATTQIHIDEETSIICTASFGVTTVSHDTQGVDEILSQADSAMYRAKKAGRNRVSLALD